MAAKPQTIIEVKLDDSAIKSQLDSLQSRFASSWTEIASKINVAKSALNAVISVGTGLHNLAKAADEAAMAETRAVATIRQYGGEATQTVAALKKYNESLQAKLGIEADSLLQMQGTLAMMGVAPDRLKEATNATIGLAEATGQDLDAAARMVAKALNGQFESLKKVGIYATSSDDAMRKLAMGFDVASQKAGTFTQKTQSLWHAMGDLTEAAGAWIAQNESIKAIASNLTYSVGRAAKLIAPGEAQPKEFVTLSDARSGPMRLTGAQEEAYAKYAEQDKRAAEKAAQIAEREKERARNKAERDEETAANRKWQQMIRQGEYEREIREKHAEEMRKIESDAFDRRAEIGWQEYEMRAEQIAERERQESEFVAKSIEFGIQSATGLFDALAEGAARGEEASQVIAKFLFGIMRQLGGALIAMGTAAVTAGAASTAAPWTIPFFGGPGGVGAGIAMIAAGTLLSAGGAFGAAAIGGGGGAGAAKAATVPRQSGFAGSDWMGRGNVGSSREGRGTTVINIEFNRPVGNPRRTAREIADMLRAGGALEGIGAG